MLASKQLRRRHLVLVVEDQEINRDVLGMILEDDYDVIYAENGEEGLEQMRSHLDKLTGDFQIKALHSTQLFQILIENV